MTIAVHISFTGSQNNARTNFNYRCFTILAAKYPADHFIFIFNRPFGPSLVTQSNITPVLLSPQIKNRLLQHYWYNFKIPRLLNKYNAAVFVSGDCVCSLRTKIPQCMLIHELSFLQKNNLYSKHDTRYLKKYLKAFINQADQIAVTNKQLLTTLKTLFPGTENKTGLINRGIDEAHESYSPEQLYEKKEKIAGGKDYFLFYGTTAAAASSITMLKAFSIFKKWQKSNMRLVMLIPPTLQKDTGKDLSTYKYRNDVSIFSYEPEENDPLLIAAAYAVVYLPTVEIIEPAVLYTLQSNIPLIARDTGFCKGIFKDAALYTSLAEKDISEKMMHLYKDENSRNDMAALGKSVSAEFTWTHAADILWQRIQVTAEQ